jgi:hypothetical protein
MPIVIEPESGIPFPFDTTPEEIVEFRDRAKAAVETIKEIVALGGEVEITEEDRTKARGAAASNAPLKISEKNAGSLVHLEAILSEYDRDLLNASSRLRSYVTNKLLLETIDEDARIRLKALELLGKVGSVGLFTERVEVDMKVRSVDQVDAELSSILEKYLGDVEEVPEDNELDQVIRERSLLEMSDEELGLEPELPDPGAAENEIDPKDLVRLDGDEIVDDFDKP